MVKFSIIIPTFNSSKFIERSLISVLNQDYKRYQIIIVDDSSVDDTIAVCKKLAGKNLNIKIIEMKNNGGPGKARNKGIMEADGEYLLFLDSDDELEPNALMDINERLDKKMPDILTYDFKEINKDHTYNRMGRQDLEYFAEDRKTLLESYLKLWMDGSVIFTVYRKDFLKKYNIMFRMGIHEDVDFLFKAIFFANEIEVCKKKCYLKNNRDGSIINTLTEKHLHGFFAAYAEMLKIVQNNDNYTVACKVGVINLIAIKVRDILKQEKENKEKLYQILYFYAGQYIEQIMEIERKKFNTMYEKLVISFWKNMKTSQNIKEMEEELFDIVEKSWSCYDLCSSLFLGPDEIRTCCKRFFAAGKQKGDIVLTKVTSNKLAEELYEQIFEKKRELYKRINQGVAEECIGCPFLEFKKWNNADMKIKKISFEYHSLCNLRCKYCSEKYYGGVKPQYDIVALIQKMIDESKLKECESFVWGGGEPTIEKNFPKLMNMIDEAKVLAKSMIITNGVKYSEDVNRMLEKGKVKITTSIDAGSEKTYKYVRGVDQYLNVLRNLSRYAKNKEQEITIKYIILNENSEIDELKMFAEDINQYALNKCNFQISCNFKTEVLEKELLNKAVALFCLLKTKGAEVVFFDELLRERIGKICEEQLKEINSFLFENEIVNMIAKPEEYKEVFLWGSENQILTLLNNSLFLRKTKVSGLVTLDDSKIGTKFEGYSYQKPNYYLNKKSFCIIAAVQGTPRINKEFKESGLKREQLINKIIL